MIDYTSQICKQCKRKSSCQYPCNKYCIDNNYSIPVPIVSSDDNDIANFLEYTVEDVEWLRCLNGQIPYTELIDKNALLSYLEECNEKYCKENNLCHVCRNQLVEVEENRGEHFGISCGEVMWHCPNGCE